MARWFIDFRADDTFNRREYGGLVLYEPAPRRPLNPHLNPFTRPLGPHRDADVSVPLVGERPPTPFARRTAP